MRILMVSDVYFPRVNGVSTSIETLSQALGAHGVEVRLVTPRYGDESDTADVIRVPGRPIPGRPEKCARKAVDRSSLELAQASTYE